MSGADRPPTACGCRAASRPTDEVRRHVLILRMGIDIAVRAPHQASLADERGELLWSGHRFRTTAADLERLWELLPEAHRAGQLTVIMEPTRNAWVPLAAWLRRKGAQVVLVSAERSSDLRSYYAKHTRATGWTPCCWPGCRCCTPKGCTANVGSDRVTRFAGGPS